MWIFHLKLRCQTCGKHRNSPVIWRVRDVRFWSLRLDLIDLNNLCRQNHANPVLHQHWVGTFLLLVSPEFEFPFEYHQSRTMVTFSLLGHPAQMPFGNGVNSVCDWNLVWMAETFGNRDTDNHSVPDQILSLMTPTSLIWHVQHHGTGGWGGGFNMKNKLVLLFKIPSLPP